MGGGARPLQWQGWWLSRHTRRTYQTMATHYDRQGREGYGGQRGQVAPFRQVDSYDLVRRQDTSTNELDDHNVTSQRQSQLSRHWLV